MPAPQASAMQQLARLTFTSYNVTVPHQWTTPSGDPDGKHYADAFKPEERSVPPPAPTLFFPATPNKYHVDTAKELNSKIGGFIDDMCTAICGAWDKWQKAASLVGLVITGPVGVGGSIVAPPLGPLILATAPKVGNFGKYAMVIANEIGMGWDQFVLTCKAAPPLPLWPMFTVFPSPAAVNIPSVPMPFASLLQVPVTISASILKMKMVASLADPQAWFAKDLFGAIATAFENCYNLWKTTTMITNVLGNGPVPSMLIVPTPIPGPVLGGVGVMAPGGLV